MAIDNELERVKILFWNSRKRLSATDDVEKRQEVVQEIRVLYARYIESDNFAIKEIAEMYKDY